MKLLLGFFRLTIASFLRFVFLIMVLTYAALWFNNYKQRVNDKPCYDAVLPQMRLCLPRSYYMARGFSSNAGEAYNWKKMKPSIDPLTLLIPRSHLPILPSGYGDGNLGYVDKDEEIVGVSLQPRYITQKEYLKEYQAHNNGVVEMKDDGTFIKCFVLAHEAGNPEAKKVCEVSTDLDV